MIIFSADVTYATGDVEKVVFFYLSVRRLAVLW